MLPDSLLRFWRYINRYLLTYLLCDKIAKNEEIKSINQAENRIYIHIRSEDWKQHNEMDDLRLLI